MTWELATGHLLKQRYEVEAGILVCRWSTLYRAYDHVTGTPVIIRWLRPPPFDGDGTLVREQLLQEGALLARLNHRNLPRVLEVLEEEHQLYLLLDDFEGRTLDMFVKEHHASHGGSLSESRLVQLLQQFVDVLGFLHGQSPPIIHRDLRPHSVMLSSRGLIILAEFGLARMEEPGSTRFGCQGSSNYAAPEQIAGSSRSRPATDLYSLGCILYFLATGQHPPRSSDRLLNGVPCRPLREARPDLSESLAALVDRMMEVRPDMRFDSTADVRRALGEGPPTRGLTSP